MSFSDPFYIFFAVLILLGVFALLSGMIVYYIRKPIGKALMQFSFFCGFIAWTAAAIKNQGVIGIIPIAILIAAILLLYYLKGKIKSEKVEKIVWVAGLLIIMIFALITLPLIFRE
jgi:hypothetical protein